MHKIWSGSFSHMLRYTPRKWVSYSQEILRHRSQFLSKKGEKILREVGRISRNLWGGGSQISRFEVENPDRSGSQFAKTMKNIWIAPPEHYAVTFCFFFWFFMSLIGKEVKKDETYMAKNTGDGWETMITYPIFYYSHTTLNGDLSMFFFRCNCCWLYM